LTKVFAGLQLSKRTYRSCISLTLAFLSYRNQFNLGLATTIEETWAYFVYALSTELKGISSLTQLQLIRQDKMGKYVSQNHLIGISVVDQLDLHEAISKLTLYNSSYLFSSVADLKQGRLLSFLCSQEPPGWKTPLPAVLYVDRYLSENSGLVFPLLERKRALEGEVEGFLLEIKSIESELETIHDTIEFLSGERDLQHINGSLRQLQIHLDAQKQALDRAVTERRGFLASLFSIPELQRHPFSLYAVFRQESASEHVVYIFHDERWWKYKGKCVEESSYELVMAGEGNITFIWYTSQYSKSDRCLALPLALVRLIDQDNKIFDQEIDLSHSVLTPQ
ncbi:hypothetical protein HDU91_000225, partial [Kappamyces sp. JEL0680]